jgi:tetratricopeptide (TPR) repeat protein
MTQSRNGKERRAGRELLRRVIEEYPDDALQATMAHEQLARSLAKAGELEHAAEQFERALEGLGSVQQYAEVGLAEVIVDARWSDRYDEAADLLASSEASRDPFPAIRFRWNRAAARLAALQGAREDAAELAAIALRCLEVTESPFPRHRGLGLASADRATVRELRRLAR